MPPEIENENESLILCQNSQGTQLRATLLRMTRYLVTFEVYNPYSILQLSEVLADFEIIINGSKVYSGRATVNSMVNTGLVLVCEASLEDESWLNVDMLQPAMQIDRLADDFERVLKEWGKVRQVSEELKILVADMQSLLADLRRWLEHVEMAIRSTTPGERIRTELTVIERLNSLVLPITEKIFSKFEQIAGEVPEEAEAVHRAYVRRQLHPLVLCSPFLHRTYAKPLGYAGDYEMVNMILRDPVEGASLFAKLINTHFVGVAPAEAHRNRVKYLYNMLRDEVRTRAKKNDPVRIFNLGCGPAKEVQDFLIFDDLCEKTSLSLLDFNDETLAATSRILSDLKMRYRRTMPLRMIKRSVHQVLKDGIHAKEDEIEPGHYHIIYCAGLFDYLSDRICRRLLEMFYEMVAPGGLVVATNVEASNPARRMMEYLMEWHLIYRTPDQFQALAPAAAPRDGIRVSSDSTGVNIFLEIHKPEA